MRVLSHDWDPIGFGDVLPNDEYECAADAIATLLRSGGSREQVAEKLAEHWTGHVGLDRDPTADWRAAEAVVAWYAVAIEYAPSAPSSGVR
jgi:hypothetical protein